MRKIGFIGAGNMAQAIIQGMLAKNVCLPNEVIVYNHKYAPTLEKVVERHQIKPELDLIQFMKDVDIVILAVKPAVLPGVLEQIQHQISKNQLLVSIAAGVSIERIQSIVGNKKIVRVMPNTPSMVGEGMSSLSFSKEISHEEQMEVQQLIESFGKSQVVPESLIDAVVGVSGSAPAYVYLFIEALADGAVAEGMPREQAYLFAAQTVFGSAKMVMESGRHPGELKDQVCSPGGTTIEAVQTLENHQFRSTVMRAVRAAAKKNRELN